MRLIDADVLKEALMNRLYDDEARIIEIVEEEITNAPTVDTTFREVVAYECGQKSVEERPKGWIPVTERLPENDDDVLITRVYNGITHYFVEKSWFNECKFLTQDGEFEFLNVVAWMPLPEPYKGGDA